MESAPWKILSFENKEIQIDVDGAITIDGVTKRPFPIPISHAIICDKGLVAIWIDHELRLARMALLELDEPLNDGMTKGELRAKRGSAEVEGSTWCHILDSEPLAITSREDLIIFPLWQRGIYAIQSDSTEIWRTGLPELTGNNPPGAEDVAALHIGEDVHVWTRSGDHLKLDIDTGEEKESFTLPIEADLKEVFHDEGQFLLSAKDGWTYASDGFEITLAHKQRGTIQDAVFDGEKWRIICWRDDAIFGGESVRRNELGVQIINRDGKWMVIDNQWEISPHMGE